jgi:CRP-like cAMP-binding protein
MTAFDRVKYFNDLPELVSNELMYSLVYTNYSEGDFIQAEGDTADRLMIISKGKIRIDFKIKDMVAAQFIKATEGKKKASRKESIGLTSFVSSLSKNSVKKNLDPNITIILDSIGIGSVINANAILISDTIAFDFVAEEPTTIYWLSYEFIEDLSKHNAVLK